jgi:hypothetical protein
MLRKVIDRACGSNTITAANVDRRDELLAELLAAA